MHYSLAIALRYLRARRRSGLVSRVTLIAVGGTLVGVATLIIVLSLMNGFEAELRSRIIEFNTHVLAFSRNEAAWNAVDSISAEIGKVDGVLATAPFIRGESLLYYEFISGLKVKTKGVIVKGVDIGKEKMVSTVIDSFSPPVTTFETSGFEDGADLPGIVLGEDLALDLKISYGEILTLVSAPAEMQLGTIKPRTREFRVIGFFKTGVFEFDSRFAYIDIREAATFYDFEASTRGLGIRIRDIYKAELVDEMIVERLQSPYWGTNNWIDLNSNLFSYIKVEKILMFLSARADSPDRRLQPRGDADHGHNGEKERDRDPQIDGGLVRRHNVDFHGGGGHHRGRRDRARRGYGAGRLLRPVARPSRPAKGRLFHKHPSRAGEIRRHSHGGGRIDDHLLLRHALPELGGVQAPAARGHQVRLREPGAWGYLADKGIGAYI